MGARKRGSDVTEVEGKNIGENAKETENFERREKKWYCLEKGGGGMQPYW